LEGVLTLKTRCLLFFNEFRKNPVLKTAYILYFLLTFAWSIYSSLYSFAYDDFFSGLCVLILGSLVYFVFFAFISYEFGRMDFSVGFEECCSAIKYGRVEAIEARILVMIFLAMPCLIINLLIYIIAGIVCSAGAAAIFHVLAHIVINFFVVPLIGTLLGAVLAIYAKRGVAYIVLLVITFFSSPAVNGFCADLYYSTGISANRWLRVFPFMTPSSFFYTPNIAYGYSLRPYRLFAFLMWILVLCALLLFFFARNRYGKHFLVLGVACLTLGLCCAPIVLQNNSDNIEDIESTEEVGGEIRYYIINKTSPPDACPEFKITSYDMELKLSNVLHAEVKVSVSPSNLDIYGFTLYHGYKVKEVKDESGRDLKFRQNDDWIEVESAGETSSLTFTYSGYSNTHYSNGQGASLPGTFAYYPRAGYVTCYGDTGYETLTLDEPTQFDVKIKNRKKFFTNLNRTGKNTFSGKTTGLTIVGGFYKEDKIGDTNLVYTYVDMDVNEIKKVFSNLMQTYDRSFNTVMVTQLYDGVSMRDYGDTLVFTGVSLKGIEMDYFLSQVPESRGDFGLQAYIFEYMRGTFEEYAEGDKSIGMNTRYVRVEAAADKYGDEYCRKAIDKYLYDESDTRTPDEFINDLNRGTENVEN
jgi:hypothetical protein